jgi:hypothetical protein
MNAAMAVGMTKIIWMAHIQALVVSSLHLLSLVGCHPKQPVRKLRRGAMLTSAARWRAILFKVSCSQSTETLRGECA